MKSKARLTTFNLKGTLKRGAWQGVTYFILPNAAYLNLENQMVIPYQSLDGWWFDADRPEPLNIATLSAGVFHEITHGFDSLGSQFDHEGLSHFITLLYFLLNSKANKQIGGILLHH